MGDERQTHTSTQTNGELPSDWAYSVIMPRVVSEGIDGEVLAIDNDTGTYFNIEGAGVEIWFALVAGATREAVVDAVTVRYDVDEDVAGADADSFVAEIVKLGVLGPMSIAAVGDPAGVDSDRIAYRPPVLSVYTDLQDLLLFDPIHEVADAGWPHQSV